jgi:hypothetical protein
MKVLPWGNNESGDMFERVADELRQMHEEG